MRIRNQELYNALYNLTKVAIQEFSSIELQQVTSVTKWERENDDTFVRRQVQQPYTAFALHDLQRQLEKSKEYSDFSLALADDITLDSQVGELVGTSLGLARLDQFAIARWAISGFIKDGTPEKLLKAVFNPIYRKIEAFLYTNYITFETLTPLSGFSMDNDKIRLSTNHTIEKLNDSEISEILGLGIKLGIDMGDMGFQHNVQEYAIRSVYRLEKKIGNIENRESDEQFKLMFESRLEQNTIDALRLFKAGEIKKINSIRKAKSIFEYGTSYSTASSIVGFVRDKYVLNESEVDGFRKFCTQRQNPKLSNSKYLKICIRRFSQSNERTSTEDKIIDLMIAAESIFLSSSGSFQGELKYRLSHRAAMFIGDVSTEQFYIFEFMRKAYDVRSSIVHGSEPKLPQKHDGSNYKNLDEFCIDLAGYLRIAIRTAIGTTVRSRKKAVVIDWNKIIFP